MLELDRIGKSFGANRVLHDISLQVRRGETLALLGASGSGKTTMLRIISGFEQPDAGVVRISGETMGRRRPYERNIGLLFQDYALFPHMTVQDNVAYGMRRHGVPRAEIPGRIADLLRMTKLQGFERRYTSQLSGGQRQRVALARALATKPPLVLLDEPLSALDAKLRLELRLELKAILSQTGCATVVVTHDHEEAMSLGDWIVILDRGRIAQSGHPESIYEQPASRFVADFLGRANWFRIHTCDPAPPNLRRGETDAGETILVPAAPGMDGKVDVCVRPERMVLWPDDQPRANPGGAWNVLTGRLVERAYLGLNIQFVVALASGQQIVVLQANKGDTPLQPGASITVGFRPQDCILFPAQPDASAEE